MDNHASKNTKDMIGSLQMKYNRGRQAAITNKLVDISASKFKILFCVTNFVGLGVWFTPLFTLTDAGALWEVHLYYKH